MRKGVVTSNTRATRTGDNVWRSYVTLLENAVSFEVVSACAEDHLWEDCKGKTVTITITRGMAISVALCEEETTTLYINLPPLRVTGIQPSFMLVRLGCDHYLRVGDPKRIPALGTTIQLHNVRRTFQGMLCITKGSVVVSLEYEVATTRRERGEGRARSFCRFCVYRDVPTCWHNKRRKM
jgi:PAS domain-containing protein